VIFDTFINPRINPIPLKTICNIMKKHKIVHFSSYPSLENTFNDTWHSDNKIDEFDYKKNMYRYKQLENFWVTGKNKTLKQIEKIEHDILKRKITHKNSNFLQNGYSGHGLNYFVGQKL
jgi:hypothetical protein